jgi:hypothetical protein
MKNVSVVEDGDFTVVQATRFTLAVLNRDGITAEGIARRSNTDKFRPDVGVNRAKAQAERAWTKKARRKTFEIHTLFQG